MADKKVTSQLDIKQVASPVVDDPDRWAAFRQVEIISLEWTQRYKHSLGKYSRFFIELENRRFFGTRCSACEKIFTPPRPLCPACLQVTEWEELEGTGTLQTYSPIHFPATVNEDVKDLETPIVLAYVLMDGSSTLFPHILIADPERVTMGMRVQVAYSETLVEHPIHLMHFIPMEI